MGSDNTVVTGIVAILTVIICIGVACLIVTEKQEPKSGAVWVVPHELGTPEFRYGDRVVINTGAGFYHDLPGNVIKCRAEGVFWVYLVDIDHENMSWVDFIEGEDTVWIPEYHLERARL